MTSQTEIRRYFCIAGLIQTEELEAFCFGECKKIIFNRIINVPFPEATLPCSVCHEDKCEHEDRRLDMGRVELVDGEVCQLIVRKLKKVLR